MDLTFDLTRWVHAVTEAVSRRALERASAACELFVARLHALGTIERAKGTLWLAGQPLHEQQDLLSQVASTAGACISMFVGNRCIASVTVADAGRAREAGSFADAQLVDTVLRMREPFRGVLQTADGPLWCAAVPLVAGAHGDTSPLGMVIAQVNPAATRDVLELTTRESLQHCALSDTAEHMHALLGFMDDVARRLQLLALNGNILAAQAGEHGQAFRVVCRELAGLAAQTKDEIQLVTHGLGLAETGAWEPSGQLDAASPAANEEIAPLEAL